MLIFYIKNKGSSLKELETLQKEYDEILTKIKISGHELIGGKITKFDKKMVLFIDAEYYSHFDGHDNEAIYEDDKTSFIIPNNVIEDMKKLTEITFDIVPHKTRNRMFSDTYLEVKYNNEKIGELYLNQGTRFTNSWMHMKELTYIKNNEKEWTIKGSFTDICPDETEQHSYVSSGIREEKIY